MKVPTGPRIEPGTFRRVVQSLRMWLIAFRRDKHAENEEPGSSKTSLPIYQTTRCHNPTAPIHIPLRKPVKSYMLCGSSHELGGKPVASHREGPGSNFRPVYVGFVMDKMAMGQVFIRLILFQFPVSNFVSLLHTHAFIYHRRCIMIFSQYFSFPLSVSFHHCSIFIHSSTTHAV